MKILNLITDPYERQARFYPSVLLIAPIVLSIATIFSPHLGGVGLQTSLAVVVGLGGVFFLSQIGRDSGKRCEVKLFEEWGGMPSIAIFRYRDKRLDMVTKSRYHKKMSTLVKDVKAPTQDEEKCNPEGVDIIYSAWSNYLRVNVRDPNKFALVFQENVSYGYRRNVLGLRAIGIACSLASLIMSSARVYFVYSTLAEFDFAAAGSVAFSVVMLCIWMFLVTSEWVRVPAEAYAVRLVECVEGLPISDADEDEVKKPKM